MGHFGQVASSLAKILPDADYTRRETLDLEHPANIERALERYRPSVVINPGAFTAVDRAEAERERAFRINAESPGVIAAWCAAHDVPLIHFSTDYVYPGTDVKPWGEDDPLQPLNAYGQSKLEGEREVERRAGPYLILRTSWVYSPTGQNFVRTMLKLGAEREELRVVDDQIGAPTSAADLAAAVTQFIAHPELRRTRARYNIANGGDISWAGFAREIFAGWRALGHSLKVREVISIASAEYPTPAKRPLNSRLNCDRLAADFGVRLRPRAPALLATLRAIESSAAEASSAPI